MKKRSFKGLFLVASLMFVFVSAISVGAYEVLGSDIVFAGEDGRSLSADMQRVDGMHDVAAAIGIESTYLLIIYH